MGNTFQLTLNADAIAILRLLTDAQQGQLLMALATVAAGDAAPTFRNRPMAALFHILRALLHPTPGGGEREGDIEGVNKGGIKNNFNLFSSLSSLNPSNLSEKKEKEKKETPQSTETPQDSAAEAAESAAEPAESTEIPAENSESSENLENSEFSVHTETSDPSDKPDLPDWFENSENTEDSTPVTDSDCAFDAVWRLYAKDVGDMTYLRSRWASIGMDVRRDIVRYVRRYVQVRPDPRYRRNFRNFLEMRTWETEPLEQVAAATRHATDSGGYHTHYYAEQPHQPTRESILREIQRQKEENRRGEELMRKHGLGHLLDD